MQVELSITLSAKQEAILNSCECKTYDYVVVRTGRQVGKTLTAQIAGFKWAMKRENVKVGFFLPTYKQCKNIFNRYRTMLTEMVEKQLVSFVGAPDFSIKFFNGSTIQFFSCQNDNFRGNTFDYVIVDEACFISDEIFAVLVPCVAVSLSKNEDEKGKILLLSTPKQKNYFHKLCETNHSKIKRYSFTSEEGGIISKDVLDFIKHQTPEHIFRNEYMGEFLDSGNGLFKYLPCIKDINDNQGVTAALDLGSVDDWTVLTIFNKNGNLIFIDRWQHQDYDKILDCSVDLLHKYGKPTVYIETNGVGQMPYEYCKKKYKGVTKPWNTNSKSKNDMILQLILDFNQKNITISNIPWLKDELDNFTVEWKNGVPTYGGSNGFHDDGVMSLAIANFNRPKITNIKPATIRLNNKHGMV